MAARPMPGMLAMLSDAEDEPVVVVADLPPPELVPEDPSAVVGLGSWALQWNVPLTTLFFFKSLNFWQLILPVDCKLKRPLTSLSEERSTLKWLAKSSLSRIRRYSLVELTAEVNGTSHSLEIREVQCPQLVIAGDQEATVNLLQCGHADVLDIVVAEESQVHRRGQVGSNKLLEGITPESKTASQVGEHRKGDIADVPEGHVGAADELGELNRQTVVVTSKVDEPSGVGETVNVDLGQESVLSDDQAADGAEGDAFQVGKTGVGNEHIAGLGNALSEIQALQQGQSLPVDAADTGQGVHLQRRQASEAVQFELVADRVELRSTESAQLGGIEGRQATSDLLDTVQGNDVGGLMTDLDIALQGLAGAVAIGIALALDLDGVTAAAVIWWGQPAIASKELKDPSLFTYHWRRRRPQGPRTTKRISGRTL